MRIPILFFISLSLISPLYGISQINLNQGLISYYPFNGNANDNSSNGVHGLPQGNIQLTADRFGNPNSAYSFDGIDDYIKVPMASALNQTNSMTIAFYFNSQQSSTQTIIGKIAYNSGIGAKFQIATNFNLHPGVLFAVNPPAVGCVNQISLNSTYVNTGQQIPQNQWHCIVASFENGVQRIYLDGLLMETINTGFNLLNHCDNSDIHIGTWWSLDPQRFKGKIDDVRIYDRALTQDEINALCSSTTVIPSFDVPDTVCVNTPVSITNNTTGASTYFWDFCVADANVVPEATNLSNPGGNFSQPVFIDLEEFNGNYYGFSVNHYPGGIVRLDFGNSLLNNPTSVLLGNPGNAMNSGYGNEGIQIVKANGNWYGIVVGGNPASSSTPRLVIVKFGPNLNNPNPTAVNWGNIGNMLEPMDLHVFEENGLWYGFTVNAVNNTITRFNFTESFENQPTGVNLGNIGNLSYPDGIFAINDNGFWRIFVTNGLTGNSSLTRLDFGNSLLNTPTGVNLGNIGGAFSSSRDITILKYCGTSVGFVVNGSNSILRLNFNSLSSIPTVTNLGNLGNLSFSHSLSKIFRVGNDLYSLITNVQNNSMTRLRFAGCTNASIPSSTLQNPASVVYNAPGTYKINLTVDDGLPTQSIVCKQVVVMPNPVKSPLKNISICSGGSFKLGSSVKPASYLWNTGSTMDSIIINSPGTYWVESNAYGCAVRDSFIVSILPESLLDFGFNQDLCSPNGVRFYSSIPSTSDFEWSFGFGQTNNSSITPFVSFPGTGTYNVKLTVENQNGCLDSVIKTINVLNEFNDGLIYNSDTAICQGDSILISTSLNFINYCLKINGGSSIISKDGYFKPTVNSSYSITSQERGSNLVTNADFSLGNNGFLSEYTYNSTNTSEGQYGITTNPMLWNNTMVDCNDHTNGTGNLMIVNGYPGATTKVWTQTVTVTPNTDYLFSNWIQFINGNYVKLGFSINGINLSNGVDSTGPGCNWIQNSMTWNSGNNTTAEISIISIQPISGANDFGIDDIYFGPVATRNDHFDVNVVDFCDSIQISGPSRICSITDVYTYSIYRPDGCNQPFDLVVDNDFVNIISQTDTSIRLKFLQNGTTDLKVAFMSNCFVTLDSIEVSIKISPEAIELGNDVVTCRDTLINLNAGLNFESYIWQDGSNLSTYQAQLPGLYHIQALNFCGAEFSDSFYLIKNSVIPFSAQPSMVEVCAGDSVEFIASGGNMYQWLPAGNFFNSSSNISKAIIDASEIFTVHITDEVCQRDTIINISVVASSSADIELSKSNDVNCGNDSAILIANGGLTYFWWPDQYVSRTDSGKIVVKPTQDITYYVSGIDSLGCTGIDSIRVYFKNEGEQKLFIPTAFTPNGDGKNDIFKPVFVGPSAKYDLFIYNRWGQLVFRTNNPNTGWNGRFASRMQPNGVYVYYIFAEGGCNGTFERKGTFVLIK